ncbi:MAG: hypothetical protein JWO36_621 [Myxococcales bacterium]|nr:hypothetical protein [Myxococcales bacterium]
MKKPFWACALVTLLSAGVSAGFSVMGLLGTEGSDNFAGYAASRSIALLLGVLIATGVRSRIGIVFLGIVMTMVQALDGVIGALAHDPSKTFGPLTLAVLNGLALLWLRRESP